MSRLSQERAVEAFKKHVELFFHCNWEQLQAFFEVNDVDGYEIYTAHTWQERWANIAWAARGKDGENVYCKKPQTGTEWITNKLTQILKIHSRRLPKRCFLNLRFTVSKPSMHELIASKEAAGRLGYVV